VAQDKPRKERLERRTIWVLALAVFAVILPTGGLALYGVADTWTVVIWIVANGLLMLAILAAGLALAPASALLPGTLGERRPELVTVALLLLWLGLVLIVVHLSIVAVDAIGEDF
jgi:hypothetical protein